LGDENKRERSPKERHSARSIVRSPVTASSTEYSRLGDSHYQLKGWLDDVWSQ